MPRVDVLLLAAALCGAGALWGLRLAGPATILVVLAGGAVAAVALLAPRWAGRAPARVGTVARVLLLALVPLSWGMLTTLAWTRWRDWPAWAPASAVVLGGLAGAAVAWCVTRGVRRAGLLVGLYLVAGLVVVLASPVVIDVRDFVDESLAAMFSGVSPYATTIGSPFDDATNARFFPPGLVVDGEIQTGFAYPSVPLLLLVPGWLLGDARIAVWAAWAVLVALLWRSARGPARAQQRGIATLTALAPGAVYVVGYAWVEPVSLLLLAAAALAFGRGHVSAPVLLGLGLASKQYFVLVLPLCLLLVPLARRLPGGLRWTVAGTALGALAPTLPFVLWDPRAWWSSVVEFTLEQPFRADSLSLPASLAELTGREGAAATLTVVAPVAGLLAAGLLAWRAERTPAAFCASVAVVLLVTTVLSKQAFPNYYFLVAGLLLVAAWLVLDEVDGRDVHHADAGERRIAAREGRRLPSGKALVGVDRPVRAGAASSRGTSAERP